MKHVLLQNSATSGLTRTRHHKSWLVSQTTAQKNNWKKLPKQNLEENSVRTMSWRTTVINDHKISVAALRTYTEIRRSKSASKAMEFYCKTSESKGFWGTLTGTLIIAFSKHIKQVLERDPIFHLNQQDNNRFTTCSSVNQRQDILEKNNCWGHLLCCRNWKITIIVPSKWHR